MRNKFAESSGHVIQMKQWCKGKDGEVVLQDALHRTRMQCVRPYVVCTIDEKKVCAKRQTAERCCNVIRPII